MSALFNLYVFPDKAKRAQQGDLIRFQVPNNATSVVLNKETETIFVAKRAEEESGKKLEYFLACQWQPRWISSITIYHPSNLNENQHWSKIRRLEYTFGS